MIKGAANNKKEKQEKKIDMDISVLVLPVQFTVKLLNDAFSFRQSPCNVSHHPIYQLQLLFVMLFVIVIAYWVQSVVSYFCISLRSRLISNSPHYLGYSFRPSLLMTWF